MSRLIPILLYLQAAWSTLVVPCATNPENWKACSSNWDVWLLPEIQRGVDLVTGAELPYAEEHGTLSEFPTDEP